MSALSELIERHYANVAAGDPDADRKIMHHDVLTIDPGAGRVEGIDAFIEFEKGFHLAFPDGRMEMSSHVEAGSTIVAEGTFVGTHTGPLVGPAGTIPPSGKTLRLEFCDVFEVVDGRIKQHRIYYDQISFLAQLGLMPAPAAG
jgi:steroid delta-isomerase-like uncharacterized protein